MRLVSIWRSDYLNSLEYAIIEKRKSEVKIDSSIIISSFKGTSYKIEYHLVLSSNWKFKYADIVVDNEGIQKRIDIIVDRHRNWSLNNQVIERLKWCFDIDLGFTPLTNTLPVNRLEITNRKQANITVAWLEFPSFELRPFNQTYTKLNDNEYLYESGTDFKATIKINKEGFVTKYQDYWTMIGWFENT